MAKKKKGVKKTILECDGACQDGHGVYGFVVFSNDIEIHRDGGYIGPGETSNTAEYQAIIHAMEWALDNNLARAYVRVLSDSRLAINQITGELQCHQPHLKKLRSEVWNLCVQFDDIDFRWISRGQNESADEVTRDVYREVFGNALQF